MATITAGAVKDLRERTGARMMDCKRALEESDGDVDKAVLLLRERGLRRGAKKSGREAREGLISSYIHTGGRVGVLIEVNCETDFVAATEQFQQLVRTSRSRSRRVPSFVDVSDIPARCSTPEGRAPRRRRTCRASRRRSREDRRGPPQQVVRRAGAVLLEQPFRDSEQTVRQLITDAIATIGENIQVRRFTRYALGEDR
jgi:elongation factor Ts